MHRQQGHLWVTQSRGGAAPGPGLSRPQLPPSPRPVTPPPHFTAAAPSADYPQGVGRTPAPAHSGKVPSAPEPTHRGCQAGSRSGAQAGCTLLDLFAPAYLHPSGPLAPAHSPLCLRHWKSAHGRPRPSAAAGPQAVHGFLLAGALPGTQPTGKGERPPPLTNKLDCFLGIT